MNKLTQLFYDLAKAGSGRVIVTSGKDFTFEDFSPYECSLAKQKIEELQSQETLEKLVFGVNND